MKQSHLFRVLHHAFIMVGRTIRSYALLSVTVVLSFSLLLSFLGFMDTSLYNQYKGIFSVNRGNIKVEEGTNPRRFEVLLEKAQEMPDTRFYIVNTIWAYYTDARVAAESGEELGAMEISVRFLPDHVWEYFYWLNDPVDIQWLDGKPRQEISLKENEAILDKSTFLALGLDKMDIPVYRFRLNTGGKQVLEQEVQIVGIVDQHGDLFVQDKGRLRYNASYAPMLLLSMGDLTTQDLKDLDLHPSRYAIFYTESPERLASVAEGLGFELPQANAMFRVQDAALDKIRTQKATKAVVVGALLLLLGVNLYSSFTNALNDRKFEIGVKRAIGASSFSIVRQFLYESIIVMLVNIFISIAIVVDLGLLLKLAAENFYCRTPGQLARYGEYILYLSPHSALMFGICAITLTVVFSLIFAYKSTQVEIVQYLKAE